MKPCSGVISMSSIDSFEPINFRIWSLKFWKNFYNRGVVRCLKGQMPIFTDQGFKGQNRTFLKKLPRFNHLWKWWFPKKQSIFPRLLKFSSLALIRRGAMQPLPNLSGCPGTRGTRYNDAPVQHDAIDIINYTWNSSIENHNDTSTLCLYILLWLVAMKLLSNDWFIMIDYDFELCYFIGYGYHKDRE